MIFSCSDFIKKKMEKDPRKYLSRMGGAVAPGLATHTRSFRLLHPSRLLYRSCLSLVTGFYETRLSLPPRVREARQEKTKQKRNRPRKIRSVPRSVPLSFLVSRTDRPTVTRNSQNAVLTETRKTVAVGLSQFHESSTEHCSAPRILIYPLLNETYKQEREKKEKRP